MQFSGKDHLVLYLKRAEETDTVVVKRLCEAINHDNGVKFKEFCQKPYGIAISLKYVYFDFSVIGDDCGKKVHSLREFLVFVDKEKV